MFSDLLSLNYICAVSLKEQKGVTLHEVMEGMGQYVHTLQGWYCRTCSYSDLSLNEMENYVAHMLVRTGIIEALTSKNLLYYAKQIFQLNIPEAHEYRENLKEMIAVSNIVLSNRIGWLRPCPQCGSQDTVVCRWKRQKKRSWIVFQTEVFCRSDDN